MTRDGTAERTSKLLDEAKDFSERMTGQPWACELVERLADALEVALANVPPQVNEAVVPLVMAAFMEGFGCAAEWDQGKCYPEFWADVWPHSQAHADWYAAVTASPSPGTATAGASDEWSAEEAERLIDHACSLALGYGASARDDVLAEYREAKANAIGFVKTLVSDKSRVERLETALKPFAEFIGDDTRIPDDMPLTAGSLMAKKQVPASAFRAARRLLMEPPAQATNSRAGGGVVARYVRSCTTNVRSASVNFNPSPPGRPLMTTRADIELVAMRLFDGAAMRTQRGHLHWYAIGRERRDLWRLLAESVLEEDKPYASPKNVKAAWEELRHFIPHDLGADS